MGKIDLVLFWKTWCDNMISELLFNKNKIKLSHTLTSRRQSILWL